MVAVDPANALDDVKLIAVRMADAVEPGLVVEIYGVGDKRVSLPMADGVPHPQRAKARVVLAPVGKDLMTDGVIFKKHDHFMGSLDHLHREGMQEDARIARRRAGVIDRIVRLREGKGMSSEGG